MSTLADLVRQFEGFGTPAAPSITNGNNPGAIQSGPYATSMGATGTSPNGTAIFDSLSGGVAAEESLLLSKFNAGNTTPESLTTSYEGSPAPSYANFIANGLGIGVNDPIPSSALSQGQTTPATQTSSMNPFSGSMFNPFNWSLPGTSGSILDPHSYLPKWLTDLTLSQIAALVIGIGLVIGGIFFLRPVANATISVIRTAKKGADLVAA